MSDTKTALPTPQTHPGLFRLAAALGKPLAIFDLETTEPKVLDPNFGIAEVAYLAIKADGTASAFSTLLNPGKPMSPKAAEITGLTDQELAGAKPFAAAEDRLRRMFENTVLMGFNIDAFDISGVLGEFEKTNSALPSKWQSIDLRKIHIAQNKPENGQGTLENVCKIYGKPMQGAHRASADVLACADLAEEMLWRHGFDAVKSVLRHGIQADLPSQMRKAALQAYEELSDEQKLLRKTIEEALPKNLSVEQFAAALQTAGFRLEVTQKGAAYVKDGQRLSGSALGDGFSWPKIRPKLSGEIPSSLLAENAPAPALPDFSDASKDKPESELSPAAQKLKALISEAVLQGGHTVQSYADALGAHGYKVEVTKGGAAYICGQERIGGSALGERFAWTKIRPRLAGEIPAALITGEVYKINKPAEAPASPASAQTPAKNDPDAAKNAILAVLGETGKAGPEQMQDAFKKSGLRRFGDITYALSNLLADGTVKPEQAYDPAAQKWLDGHWGSLPTQGKLKPLLEACQAANAPSSVDYAQIRVALAIRKAPKNPPSPAPAQNPPAASEPPPFGDEPPFEQSPSAPPAPPAPASSSAPPDDFPPDFSMDEAPPFHDDDMPPFDEYYPDPPAQTHKGPGM